MINKTNSNLVICGYRRFYDDNSKDDEYYKYTIDKTTYSSEEAINMIMNFEIKGFVWDKMFKKDFLISNGIKFDNQRYVEDWFFVFKAIYNAGKISFINQPLYNYRIRTSSDVHNRSMEVTKCYYDTVMNIIKYIGKEDLEIKKSCMNTFYINTFYNLIRNYYLAYENNKSSVYKSFNTSIYGDYKFSIDKLINPNNASLKTKLKIILWKLKIFHLAYKI